MKNYKNLFCVAPFSSITIEPSGRIFPCCAWENTSNLQLNVLLNDKSSITDYFQRMKPVRNQFLVDDNIDNCNQCSKVSGIRQNTFHNLMSNPNIDYINTPTLTNLHIRGSNLCNLACRICSPEISNLVAREQEAYEFDNEKFLSNYLNSNSTLFKSLIDQIPLINCLWFSGGEPLLIKGHWELMKFAKENGYSKNINLFVITNGTVVLTEEQISILKSFKRVDIHVSMDDIDANAEYIRTNVQFSKWISNYKSSYLNNFYQKENSDVQITIAVSVYNIHRIKKIQRYFIEFLRKHTSVHFDQIDQHTSLNFVHHPDELSIRNLSEPAKEFIRQICTDHNAKYDEQILSLLNQPQTISTNKCVEFIDSKDDNAIKKGLYKNYRPFRELEPDWYNLLKS